MGKIRITLFEGLQAVVDGDQMALIKEDRLVESGLEFMNGPKDKHDGPIRIDFTMEHRDEVEGLVKYLSQLALDLPLSEKAKKTYERKTTPNALLEKEPIMQLIEDAFHKNKTQEKLVDYLKGLNFVFLTEEHLKEHFEANKFPWNLKKLKEKKKVHPHSKYQYMVRLLRLAKDPAKDKYDPQIAFGIKLIGDRVGKVIIYLFGKYHKTVEIHWEDAKEINFKVKEKFYKFPEAMIYLDRHKWRLEDRKLLNNPELTPSGFYERWKPFVTILKPQRAKEKKK